MVATRLQVALWCVPVLLAVVCIAVRAFVPAVIAFDLVFVAVLALDHFRGGTRYVIRRTVPDVAAVGQSSTINLRIDHLGRRQVSATITDEAPGPVEGLPLEIVLPPEGRLDAEYALMLPRRGRQVFGRIVVRTRSPWGFWEHQQAFEQEQAVRVYPNFQQLRTLGIDSKLNDRNAPVRARRQSGGDSEFQRLRPYVAGDPYKHIDWRATARRRKLVTREFGQESNQNVILMIDAGRMMASPFGDGTAFDRALDAALMMGHAALQRGDRVGLLVFDDSVRVWLPPKGGRRSSNRLIHATYDVFPSDREPDATVAFRHFSRSVRRRSLVVLFSNVVDEANTTSMTDMMKGLAGRHLPLAVWMRDPGLDAAMNRPMDEDDALYHRAAAAEIATQRRHALRVVQRAGGLVVDAPAADLSGALLARYIEVKARRLL